MAIIVFAESEHGQCGKSAFEAVTFGKSISEKIGQRCIAITFGNPENAPELGEYGADEVQNITPPFDHFDEKIFGDVLSQLATSLSSEVMVISHTAKGKALAGRIAVKTQSSLVSAVNAIPTEFDPLVVQKSVYSGKVKARLKILSNKKVITVQPNSIPLKKTGTSATVQEMVLEVPESRIAVKSLQRDGISIPLPEAELVVSGGRGLRGPENWGILEDLARELGAATACSRPVADSGWRPHHEHVGQTGVAIRPNLYVAVGISGAIQHLGGVNNSRTIVVINKDPEAPFFKAADYGVVGDLFEVVPRLIAAIRKYKAVGKSG